jgi:hypothetical protein
MASILLSTIGGATGASVAGPIGGMLGYMAGNTLGNAIDASFNNRSFTHTTGSRLSELIVQTSAYGKTIPMVYGQCRIAGNVIWSLPIQEHQHSNISPISGGKGGSNHRTTITNISYSYNVTLAIAICEGPIDTIVNIWADAKLLTGNINKNFRLYKGDEHQMPDSLIEAHMGVGKTPAYRGLAYVVIENFLLTEYGNRIPNFTFEVKRRIKPINQPLAVEDLVKAICLIPGSGEFVYDTQIQYKINGGNIQQGKATPINCHNYQSKANAVLSLDQLLETCPNIERIALVVTWFATSLEIKNCKILPGVEFQQNMYTQPDIWAVSSYRRENAHQITLYNGAPIYGGTVADVSLIRYLEEIKSRKIKIMFYPMIFVDQLNKPWRGHITGSIEQIENFFEDKEGYNRFILHYAKLVRDKVDAFIIGSELIGLTKLRNNYNQFPAVDKFCQLAAKVKQVMGAKVQVTYAADWSEYHHTEQGWYNLDKLWAHPAIDFVGIDAYFPLTNDINQQYDEQKIINGWSSGEGYEFYYVDKQRRIKARLDPAYAWKNINWWWENEHINPDGQKTQWQPKSKKIWFTEFGFPSVDGATNQPNVFYDTRAYDGALPIHSKGRIDFRIQRVAVAASLRKWSNSAMIENMFLWTWDARPYPYWPNLMQIWNDGPLWLRGHWVSGKFGACHLADIIAHLCLKSGLIAEQFDVSLLTDLVDGYVINNPQNVRRIIENLSTAYFFDIIEEEGQLRFIPRTGKQIQTIDPNDLIILPEGGNLVIIRKQELELVQQFTVFYLDRMKQYQSNLACASRQEVVTKEAIIFDSNLVLNQALAEVIANINLYNDWLERTTYILTLPPNYLYLQPADIIKVEQNGIIHQMRITNITLSSKRVLKIKAVAEEISVYDFYIEPTFNLTVEGKSILFEHKIEILDLPSKFTAEKNDPAIYIAVVNKLGQFKGINLYYSIDNELHYHYLDNINIEGTIGSVLHKLSPAVAEVIDYHNKIVVVLINGKLESIDYDGLLQGYNLALIGNEIIQFMNAVLIEPNKYELSGLLRGRMGTEHQIIEHQAGDRFVLLDNNLKKIPMSLYLLGVPIKIKVLAEDQELSDVEPVNFTWHANSLKPLSPVNIIIKHLSNGDIHLSWTRRARINGWWRDNIDIPMDEAEEKYEVDILYNNQIIRSEVSYKHMLIYPYYKQLNDKVAYKENLQFDIYQISSVIGRGMKNE